MERLDHFVSWDRRVGITFLVKKEANGEIRIIDILCSLAILTRLRGVFGILGLNFWQLDRPRRSCC